MPYLSGRATYRATESQEAYLQRRQFHTNGWRLGKRFLPMTKNLKSNIALKNKLEQMASLLKFVLTLDDEEIITSTIESVIEMLQEEIDK
jgi:hypothetical protein